MFSSPNASLARNVAVYWLLKGDPSVLDRILPRMESSSEEWGSWVRTLQGFFPQMPQLYFEQLMDHPYGKFRPRYARRLLRWLNRYRSSLRWDGDRRVYHVDALPLPKDPFALE